MEEIGEISIVSLIKEYLPAILIIFAVSLPLILQKPIFGIYIITFLIPISPSVSIGETAVRDITLRAEDIIFVATLISWGIHGFKIPKNGDGVKIVKGLALLALFHAISTFFYLSPYRMNAQLLFLAKYVQYWSYFVLAFSLIENKEDIKRVILAFYLGVSLALVYWLGEVADGKIGNEIRFPFHRRFAGRENVGIFCFGVMAISLPFLLNSRGIKKLFFAVFFALATVVYFRTLSRASYLAGLTWLIFSILFLRRKDILLTTLAITIVFPFIVPDYVIRRIKYTFEGAGGGEILDTIYVESSAFVRLGRWEYFLLDQLPESPIIGFGILGVGLMDNQYLRVWGEAGTAGFIVFLYIIKKLWELFFKTYKIVKSENSKEEYTKALSIGMIGWFVGILAHMIPANTFVILQTAEMFWLLSGTIASLQKIKMENEKEKMTKAEA